MYLSCIARYVRKYGILATSTCNIQGTYKPYVCVTYVHIVHIFKTIVCRYSGANNLNNLRVHKTSSYFCNILTPKGLLQANTAFVDTHRQSMSTRCFFKYKTGRLIKAPSVPINSQSMSQSSIIPLLFLHLVQSL